MAINSNFERRVLQAGQISWPSAHHWVLAPEIAIRNIARLTARPAIGSIEGRTSLIDL